MPLERGKPSTASGKTGVPVAASGRTGAPIAGSGSKPIVGPPRAMEEAVRENLGRTHLSLRAIRDELEMFEKEIKWRDERLSQLELELQEERARTGGPDAAAGNDRLREARLQIEQHTAALRERDGRIQALVLKERELLGRVQTLTHERTKSAQALADMVKQIQEQQRRTQALEEKLAQQQREWQEREKAASLADPSAMVQPPGGWRRMSGPARVGIVLITLIIVGASLALAAGTLMRAEPRFRVAGQLVVPADQAEMVLDELKDDPRYARFETAQRPLGPQAASLTLAIETTAKDEMRRELDTLGRTLVARLTPPPATQPDLAAARDELERRLGNLDQRLADLDRQMSGLTTQPARAGLGPEMGLFKAWRELLSERQNVEAQLKLLRPRMTASQPSADQIQVDKDAITRAEAADSQLQANREALATRQQQLRELIRKSLEAGVAPLSRMTTDIAAAAKDVGDSSQDVSDPDVTQVAATITQTLTEWTKSLSELQEAWQAAAKAAGDDQADLLAVQSKLEPALIAFRDRSKAHRTTMEKAIESLGEGGQEPTKRIVLRNGLSRQLKPALDAHESALQVLKPLLSADNPDLAGLMQTVTGLRTQVTTQRERIAATARDEALRQAREACEKDVAAARAEHERWLTRAAELDAALLEQNRKALELLPQMDGERSIAQRRAELYQERSTILRELADLSHNEVQALAQRSQRMIPWYIPAEATPLPVSPRERLGQAMLFGSIPLGIGALILISLWAGQLYLRSRQLASDYERLLREAGHPR